MAYRITDAQRDAYRQTSARSRQRKEQALLGSGLTPRHSINTPTFDPAALMPQLPAGSLRALSLFSGGGGLDLGFERAGFLHAESWELLAICGDTFARNRPEWTIQAGPAGDVKGADWCRLRGAVDVIHGGPPCQPFSVAGHGRGRLDERDMWPELVRAVNCIEPAAFVAENVPGLVQARFANYVEQAIIAPLRAYRIFRFVLNAADFGVPWSALKCSR